MIRVGITGGMGTGKSTVAAIFAAMGIPVYDADSSAKGMMNNDPALRQQIIAAFGEEAYAGGQLNRSWMAERVFGNEEQLVVLNQLVHPAVIAAGEKWMQQQQTPYAIKEAAIIFESGSQRWLDFIIGVTAPLSLRIQRVMHRSQLTREEVLRRIERQMDDTIKMKLCDAVIINDEQHALIPQVIAIDRKIKAIASLQPEA
jgi:dephospho-CoA kinase